MSFSPARWLNDLKVWIRIFLTRLLDLGQTFRLSLFLLPGTGVTTYSLHPGVVQTDLWRHLNGPQQFFWKLATPFTKNSAQGAQTTIYCAVEPLLENESGGYYRYQSRFQYQ